MMANETRDRLVELLDKAFLESDDNYGMPCADQVADHLIGNGVIVPQWISVKDRLPEKDGRYLCVDYYEETNSWYIKLYWFSKDLYKTNDLEFCDKKGVSGFWSDREWCCCHHESVTHWMPLPELPKAVQKLKEMRGE